MRKILAVGIAVGAVAALGLAAPASARSASAADLSVLHAIPDTPVDVYVNGALTLDNFAPGTLAGPLELPGGAYEIIITAPDAADTSAPVLGPVTVNLENNRSYTAVAHLTEAGQPGVNLFTNDTATTAAGQGRLTVRHVAAAPAVDILAGGTAVVEDLTNPNEATLNLPVSTVSASVALAGTTEPVLGPADVPIQDGVLTIVYAWGSASAGNLALATQTVSGLHSNPGGVNSGVGGQLAERDAMMQSAWIIAFAFGAAVIAVSASIVARRRVDNR